MYGVIVDTAFNFCDTSLRCFLYVIEMSIYCRKTHLKFFHKNCCNLIVFYHDTCFYAKATNKMTLIWVSFDFVAIKPFEECLGRILQR